VDGFLNSVLDQWLIHQGKHFFRLGLGGWKKTGTKPRGWEDCFANLCVHQISILPITNRQPFVQKVTAL
jgi:hypothetical protein